MTSTPRTTVTVGRDNVPVEDLHTIPLPRLATLGGSSREPAHEVTQLGALFMALTSNVDPGRGMRVKDVREAAGLLKALAPQGRGVLSYSMLNWGAPQIVQACREVLTELDRGGDTEAGAAIRLLDKRTDAELAPLLNRASRSPYLPGDGGLSIAPRLIQGEGCGATAMKQLAGLNVAAVLQRLLQLQDAGHLHIVAIAERNIEGRQIETDERYDQARSLLVDSDLGDEDEEVQERTLQRLQEAVQSQMEGRGGAERALHIFLLPKAPDIENEYLNQVFRQLVATCSLSSEDGALPSISVDSDARVIGERLVTTWEGVVLRRTHLDSLTPQSFVDWQRRVFDLFGIQREPTQPAGASVTKNDIHSVQRVLHGELRLGTLRQQSGSTEYRFEPEQFEAEVSPAGLLRIIDGLLDLKRRRSEYAFTSDLSSAQGLSTWLDALYSHFGRGTPPPPMPSLAHLTATLLERELVWTGACDRYVEKAWWDDEWHFVHDRWSSCEVVRGSVGASLLADSITPGEDAVTTSLEVNVYLARSLRAAQLAAKSLAELGRFPQQRRGSS